MRGDLGIAAAAFAALAALMAGPAIGIAGESMGFVR